MLQKIKFAVFGLDMIRGAIRRWRPSELSNEKAYEADLFQFLQDTYDGLSFSRQFAVGNAIADIAVEREVLIELKHKLDAKAKYDRLVGQLVEYDQVGKPLVLVICGKSDNQYVKAIKKALNRLDIETGFVYLPKETRKNAASTKKAA